MRHPARRLAVSVMLAVVTLVGVAPAVLLAGALAGHAFGFAADSHARFQVSVLAVLLASTAAIVVFCLRSDSRERSVLFGRWRVPARWYVYAVLAALGVRAFQIMLSASAQVPHVPGLVEQFFGRAGRSLASTVLAVSNFGIVFPVIEEIAFRRGIYALLTRARPWIPFVVSVGLFTIVHSPEARGGALLIGAAAAYLYQRTGSLLPSIACHGLSNVLAVAISASLMSAGSG